MVVVVVSWVLFRAHDVHAALAMYKGMIGLNGFAVRPETAWQVGTEEIAIMLLGIAIVYAEPHVSRLQIPTNDTLRGAVIGRRFALVVSGLAVLCVMRIAEQSFSPFLYFQF
jgi:alginate O-acetyltransferase complex protein AlgI